MTWIILAVLAGLNLCIFPFRAVNMWTAQGFWFHLGVVALFFYSFFERPRNEDIPNKPVALLFLWIAINTAAVVFSVLEKNRYDVQHFFQYFNLFAVLIFYRFVVQYSDERFIENLKTVIKYTIVFNLFVATLQYFGVSQYFKLEFQNHKAMNNIVVGIMGNGTHLSGFLAMLSPVLFTNRREDNFILVWLLLMMCFTGTTIGDPALNGFVIISAVALYYTFYKSKKAFFIILGVIAASLLATILLVKPNLNMYFFDDNGRFGLWQTWWGVAKNNFVKGIGLGSINLYAAEIPQYRKAFHLHLEYYHFLIELGIVGLILILNIVLDFFRTKVDEDTIIFKTILIGFLVSCLFTYPAHLWLTSAFAITAYAIVKGKNASFYPQTN